MSQTPLLSICIPTYQRAHLLRVMLQCLLPQVAELGALVEVCVADNASSDDTADVVKAASATHPSTTILYARQTENLGAIRNLLYAATQQATGAFVWALGDDDLVLPGAVRRVCDALRAHGELEFFYTNFATAHFPTDFPAAADGGYAGPIREIVCPYLAERPVRHWQELLDSSSSMGTQLYAHIVARSVWVRYWHDRALAPDYRTVESTYPHSAMLIEMAWDRPAHYLGTPNLVLFNGRPGWGEGQALRIVLVALPLLIAMLDDRGLGVQALVRARAYLRETVLDGYRSAISGGGGADIAQVVALSLAMGDRYPEMIDAMLVAVQETDGHVVPGVVDVVRDALSRLQQR